MTRDDQTDLVFLVGLLCLAQVHEGVALVVGVGLIYLAYTRSGS